MHKAGYCREPARKGGGYRLTRKPEDYTLGEILRAAEGNLAPASCLNCTNTNAFFFLRWVPLPTLA